MPTFLPAAGDLANSIEDSANFADPPMRSGEGLRLLLALDCAVLAREGLSAAMPIQAKSAGRFGSHLVGSWSRYAPSFVGGRAFRPGWPGSPMPHVPAPQPISRSEMGAGSSGGGLPPGAHRARELRRSEMTGGVGSGAPGLRSLAQPLRKTGPLPTLAEQSGWQGPADDHRSAALSCSTAR